MSVQLAFDILARDKASRELDQVGSAAERTGGKLDGLKGVAKGVGKAIGGIAAGGVLALGAAMVQGGKDAVAYETLAKKSAAVIKSTGNQAGISVKGVQALAGSLESLSGVDEELIINSQNVLATFTKIRNTKTDKIFDQATESALNMSVALGQDLQGATTMVGKALNDPIKGIAAMSKAGVQFTAQQKDQIKAMVEAGDTVGAQKVILGELETQFGGAAEAAGSGLGGSVARLKDVFGDTFRTVATAALPVLTSVAEGLADKLPNAIERGQEFVGGIADVFQRRLLPGIKGVAGFVTGTLVPGLGKLGKWLIEHKPILIGVGVAVGVGLVAAFTSWAISAGAAALATAAAAAPVIALGVVIAALTAGVVWAYQNVDIFRGAVDAVARFVTGTVWPAIQRGARIFTEVLIPAISKVIGFFWDFYSGVALAVGSTVIFLAEKVGSIVGFFTGLASDIGRIARRLWDPLANTFKAVLNTIIGAWNRLDFGIDVRVPGWVPGIGGKGFVVDDVFPDIPKLHTGGVFRAPPGEREGLAMLLDGERVSTPGSPAGAPTYNVTINAPAEALRRPSDITRELRTVDHLIHGAVPTFA